MTDLDPRLDERHVATIRELFAAHGYAGTLSVIDDQLDEAIFVVPAGALGSIRERDLCIALQGTLGRKVWVVEASEVWRAQSRPLDTVE